MRKIPLDKAFEALEGPWKPLVVGDVNGQELKVARLEGDFIDHRHEDTDELFLVLEGRLLMHLPGGVVELGAGEMLVVPRGTLHRPEAPEGCRVLLLEAAGTRNTGDEGGVRTHDPERWSGA